MKNTLSLLLIFLCLVAPAACAAEAPDFRNLRWGASMAEVEAAEQQSPLFYQDEENLEYRTSFHGFDCKLLYFFRDGKLIGGGYAFLHTHADGTEFIKDYDRLKEEFTSQYGKPARAEMKWKGDRYRKYPEQWGLAVVSGQLELTTAWSTERTLIGLDLQGEEDELRFSLVYYSREDYKDGGLKKEAEAREGEESED